MKPLAGEGRDRVALARLAVIALNSVSAISTLIIQGLALGRTAGSSHRELLSVATRASGNSGGSPVIGDIRNVFD